MIIKLKDCDVIDILDQFERKVIGCSSYDLRNLFSTELTFNFSDGDELYVVFSVVGDKYPFDAKTVVYVMNGHVDKFNNMTKDEFIEYWIDMMYNYQDNNFYKELIAEYHS